MQRKRRNRRKKINKRMLQNMSQMIWHAIKGAYGRQFEVSDEVIFDNFEDASDAP